MSAPVDVKRNLLMLRTMNPAVVTKGSADMCNWAADTIEVLAKTLALATYGPLSELRKAVVQDQRLMHILAELED